MTINSSSPAPTSTDEQPTPKAPPERPSALQLTASALAAMTTTALLSTLGVAGTIIGAALASVITVFANFVYTTSIHRTTEKVTAVAPHRRRLQPDDGSSPVTETLLAATPSGSHVTVVDDASTSWVQRLRIAVRAVVDRTGWRRLLAVVAGVFLLVLAAVTLIELTTGKPLANVVRSEDGAGTTVFGRGKDIPVSPAEVDVPAPEHVPGTGPGDVPAQPAVPGDVLPTDTPTDAPTDRPTPEPTSPPEPNPPVVGGDPAAVPAQPPAQPNPGAGPPPAQPDPGTEQPPEPQPTPTPAPAG